MTISIVQSAGSTSAAVGSSTLVATDAGLDQVSADIALRSPEAHG